MTSLVTTPTREPRHTSLQQVPLRSNHALDFCLYSPHPNRAVHGQKGASSLLLSPSVAIGTPPTPATGGHQLAFKSPLSGAGRCRTSFARLLRYCALPQALRQSIERLGWIGEQILHPPLRQLAEGFVSIQQHHHRILDVQWMQLTQLRDTVLQTSVSHMEAVLASHHQQQQISLPSGALILLDQFACLVHEIVEATMDGPHPPTYDETSRQSSRLANEGNRSYVNIHPSVFPSVGALNVDSPRRRLERDGGSHRNRTTVPAVLESDNSLVLASAISASLTTPLTKRRLPQILRLSDGAPYRAPENPTTTIVSSLSSVSVASDSSPTIAKRFQRHLKGECIKRLTELLQTPVTNHEVWKGILSEDDMLYCSMENEPHSVQESSICQIPTSSSSSSSQPESQYLASPVRRHAQKHLGDLWELMDEFGTGHAFMDAAVSGVLPTRRRKRRRQSTRSHSTLSLSQQPLIEAPQQCDDTHIMVPSSRDEVSIIATAEAEIPLSSAKHVRAGRDTGRHNVAQSPFGILECMGVKAARKGKYVSMRAITRKAKRTKEKRAKERQEEEVQTKTTLQTEEREERETGE